MAINAEYLEEFKEIEPYRGDDFVLALNRIKNSKVLASILKKAIFPSLPAAFDFIFTPGIMLLLKFFIKHKFSGVTTPYDFQGVMINNPLEFMIKKTVTEVSVSGLEKLDHTKNYLYISNHRDIVLDAAFINYPLTKRNLPTFEIAFGNNLLINDLVTDLLRLNKSFIVKRNQTPREQLGSTIILSKYIWWVLNTCDSIWIAQREGRAKNGDDITNPAIIKMFFLSQRKGGLEFSEFINQLHIVPVAVSYEYDPCDKLKARELYRRDTTDNYVKRKDEDFISIISGIKGIKGGVHISFGEPLSGQWAEAKDVAAAIDKFIHTNYKLWQSNYAAYDAAHNVNKYAEKYDKKYKDNFLKRFKNLPENIKSYAINAYAKPVENAEKY